jgi:hypothetical protein
LYRVKDGKELLCVPDIRRQDEDVRYQVFEQFHDEPMSGHRGIIREDIEKYIRACAPCSMYKKSRRAPQGKRAAMQIPRQVAQSYNIDFLTDLPRETEQNFDMCMIVVDRFSQRVFCSMVRA